MRESVDPTAAAALERARALQGCGVEVFDVGARSITPDAPEVDDAQEQQRLEPVLGVLRREGLRLSVDTWSAATAQRALEWGASLINYTRGELPDELLESVAASGASVAITYMPYGDAYRMRLAERVPYRVDAIIDFLGARVERARAAGSAGLWMRAATRAATSGSASLTWGISRGRTASPIRDNRNCAA